MKLNLKRTIIVGLAFLTISGFWQLYDFVIPLLLKNNFHVDDTFSGVIMSADNVLALFLLPLFGAISDKYHSKFGKRMPFIVIGTFAAVFFMLLLPLAAEMKSILFFMILLMGVLLSLAVYRSPAVALMPDVTLKPLRSKGNAVINFMGALGGVLVLGIMIVFSYSRMHSYYPMFIAVAGIMLIGVVIMMLKVKENAWVDEVQAESRSLGIDDLENDVVVGDKVTLKPEVKRSLLFILFSIALWFMGYNAVTTAFSRYATLQIGLADSQASAILMVANIGAIASYIPIGILSSKIGRKRSIIMGILFLALAFGTAFFYQGYSPLMFVNFVVAGFGWAAINVNSLPMVLELATAKEVGRYTGYYYTFSMSAQIITPILSGFLFDQFSYAILFPYAAFFVLASLVTILNVHHGDIKQLKGEN